MLLFAVTACMTLCCCLLLQPVTMLLFAVTACITLCCCLLVQLVNSVLLVAVTTVPCEGQIERDLADGLPEPAEDVATAAAGHGHGGGEAPAPPSVQTRGGAGQRSGKAGLLRQENW